MYRDILKSTNHRQIPLPNGPWVMMQKWEQVLFMHWPVKSVAIEEYVPSGLALDTFEGKAWISIVAFNVRKMRVRNLPWFPYFYNILQVNVRTYVKRNGVKGVYFFSLDTNKLLAMLGARMVKLPYFHANIKMKRNEELIQFCSIRKGRNREELKVSYQPTHRQSFYPETGSLSHWLLERYVLWSFKGRSLYRGDIHHKPWQIQTVTANLEENSVLPVEEMGSAPLIHYAASKVALIWMLKKEK